MGTGKWTIALHISGSAERYRTMKLDVYFEALIWAMVLEERNEDDDVSIVLTGLQHLGAE